MWWPVLPPRPCRWHPKRKMGSLKSIRLPAAPFSAATRATVKAGALRGRLHDGFIAGIHADGDAPLRAVYRLLPRCPSRPFEKPQQRADNAGVASLRRAAWREAAVFATFSGCFVISQAPAWRRCSHRSSAIFKSSNAVRNGEDAEVIHKFPVFNMLFGCRR